MTLNNGYYGLTAEVYDLIRANESPEESDFYQRIIEKNGGFALELACGTGRLLLPYLQKGLLVEGVDSSSDMLEICRRKAENQKLLPTLYHQSMQSLSLAKKYRTIYIPLQSFQFIYIWQEALTSLKCFYEHLEPNGQILISIEITRDQISSGRRTPWWIGRTAVRPHDGADIICHGAPTFDLVEQVRTGYYRFEVYKEGKLVETELRVMKSRLYGKYEFKLMLESVGFRNIFVHGDFTDTEASDKNSLMVFNARK